jgi:phenylacetic acid degradation operon negative regulatory protein
MAKPGRGGDIAAQIVKRLKPKTKSVLVTVYGDSIAHHGGGAWLGSLIKLAAPLGLNDRVIRTSVFRLAREEWLVAEQIGRRSFYRLTETGRRRVEAAHGRIYAQTNRPWDRHWTIVITNVAGMRPDRRKALDFDLRWQGFGQLASGVMLHPDPDEAALRQTLIEANASNEVLVLRTTAEPWVASRGASQCHPAMLGHEDAGEGLHGVSGDVSPGVADLVGSQGTRSAIMLRRPHAADARLSARAAARP